jgi:hypothetical protein
MLDYLRVATPLLALGITTLVQLSVARTRLGRGLIRSYFAGFGAGLASLLAFCAWVELRQGTPWYEAAANTVVNVGTYLALAFCFLSFLNLGNTSIRIRIFRELQQSGGRLSIENLRSLYDYNQIIEMRLNRLLSGKQVIERDGRYFLVSHALWWIAWVVSSTRRVVLGKSPEAGSQRTFRVSDVQ